MDRDERFRVASTMPDIKNKLTINIEEDTERVYWYIKFNLVLDKTSVTNNTMQIMDTDGYIMRTYIAYDTYRHLIVVSPIDSYLNNKYYILSISTAVKSQKGQHLKKEIHIMFMLVNNRISKFEILKSTAKLPNPKPRPANYDEIITTVFSFTPELKKQEVSAGKPILAFLPIKVNPLPVIFGTIIISVGLLGGSAFTFFGGVAVFSFGFMLVSGQLLRERSKIYYNLGARSFNKTKYWKAYKNFKKAYDIDRQNEFAQYGINKVRPFLE